MPSGLNLCQTSRHLKGSWGHSLRLSYYRNLEPVVSTAGRQDKVRGVSSAMATVTQLLQGSQGEGVSQRTVCLELERLPSCCNSTLDFLRNPRIRHNTWKALVFISSNSFLSQIWWNSLRHAGGWAKPRIQASTPLIPLPHDSELARLCPVGMEGTADPSFSKSL